VRRKARAERVARHALSAFEFAKKWSRPFNKKRMATTANWTLLPPQTSVRGNKTAPIVGPDGPPRLHLPCTTSPFGAGTFQPDPAATRLSIDLVVTPDMEAVLREIDEWAIAALQEKASLFFKKETDVRNCFKSCISEHAKDGKVYPSTLRCKLNTCGPNALRHWTADKLPREAPESYKNCSLTCAVVVRSIWFMASQCGVTIDVTDCLVEEDYGPECPF
jgi:hypothetical protein